MNRREFLLLPLAAGGAAELPIVVQAGDVESDRAIIWCRGVRPSPMTVEWSPGEPMRDVQRVRGPLLTAASDLTGRAALDGLPAGQQIFYRVLLDGGSASGRFRTAPIDRRDVRFFWSGDTAGQGYGINPEWGGMRIYEVMRRLQPDFFLHSGDTIYADNPIPPEIRLRDGSVWKNLVTEAKSKVAETLDQFRGNYQYNLLDAHVRQFAREVPQVWQWDDHEVLNNWSPGKRLDLMPQYREKRLGVLVERGRQAFREYAPMRPGADIYRRIAYGPLLDLFVVDMRSYRGPNTPNRERVGTRYLGRPQIAWLKRELHRSRALWKVIAADMPLGLIVRDGPNFENSANGDGPALGRELEIAGLLRDLKQAGVKNIVWLTADTHYTAAHYYDPARARFPEFDPFWEFVSGPLHAGTFGPNATDDTFGIQVVFQKAPPAGQSNLPPSAGMQFFGEVGIEGRTGAMTVTLRDLEGVGLFSKTLEPIGMPGSTSKTML